MKEFNFTPDVFNWRETSKIIEYGDSLPQLRSDAYGDPDDHNMDVAWIEMNQETEWIFHRVLPKLLYWPISKIQNMQFSTYRPGGGLGWHVDYLESSPPDARDRIVGSMLLLSHHQEFEGGEFQISTSNIRHCDEQELEDSKIPIPTLIGSMIVLDKNVWHRVTEITSGVRKSLVIWGLK